MLRIIHGTTFLQRGVCPLVLIILPEQSAVASTSLPSSTPSYSELLGISWQHMVMMWLCTCAWIVLPLPNTSEQPDTESMVLDGAAYLAQRWCVRFRDVHRKQSTFCRGTKTILSISSVNNYGSFILDKGSSSVS